MAPVAVAQLRGPLSRADDVGEQHGGQHAVGLGSVARSGQELLDLVDDGVLIAKPPQVVDAGELDKFRAGDSVGQVAAVVDRDQAVAGSVATMMGGLTVEPVPTPAPIEGGALNGSGVVVMLGTAQADKTLAELSTGTAATPETGTAPPVAGSETTLAATTTSTG